MNDKDRVLTLNRDNFEIALLFESAGLDPSVLREIDTYLDYRLYTIEYKEITSSEEIKKEGKAYYDILT